MKSTFKQECLTDCNYEISQYILCDDYYSLTKKFTKSPSKVRKDYLAIFLSILFSTIGFMIKMLIPGIYFEVTIKPSSYLYMVGYILITVATLGSLLILIILLGWRLVLLNKYLKLFKKLMMMDYIVTDVQQYPKLIQNALSQCNFFPSFNHKNFWINTTSWWLYAFAAFFNKLNNIT